MHLYDEINDDDETRKVIRNTYKIFCNTKNILDHHQNVGICLNY